MTLIELMVALAIGAFLMIGAITVFMQSRTTFRVTDSMARLQENGRFVLDAMEADIRMAGFWGLTSRSYEIVNRSGPAAADPNLLGTDDCGKNWAIDLNNPVAGSNNAWGWACTTALTPRATADTLVVRRVAEDLTTPATVTAMGNDGTLYIMSTRGGPLNGEIFADPNVPATWLDPVGTDVFAEIHRLVANGYYVSDTASAPNAGMPSLRMQTLDASTATGMRDREVLAGVEDLQIQFGIDTDAAGTEGESGVIDRYVNPDDMLLGNPNTAVLAVRIWLRIRSETDERGYVDNTNYVYADQNVPAIGDAFRRIIVSKTIYLRNARPVGS
jgi:type IV pilus assembly protein PilW